MSIIDRHRSQELDKKYFGRGKSEYGFHVLWFIIPDDTVHGKNDKHHAILRTGMSEDGKPRFIVLTSSVAITPDAKGNAELNQLSIEENVDPKTLPWIGGGTSDNASAARLEVQMTFDRIMDKCESQYEQEVEEVEDEQEVEDEVDNPLSPSPDHIAWGVRRKGKEKGYCHVQHTSY